MNIIWETYLPWSHFLIRFAKRGHRKLQALKSSFHYPIQKGDFGQHDSLAVIDKFHSDPGGV